MHAANAIAASRNAESGHGVEGDGAGGEGVERRAESIVQRLQLGSVRACNTKGRSRSHTIGRF